MSSNWSLRLLANGCYVAMEAFRSRLDAVLWSYVARECYKRSSVDLSKILEQGRQANDTQDWSEKMDRIKDIGNKLIDTLEGMMPQDSQKDLMQELERLKEENAKLKEQQAGRSPQPAESWQPDIRRFASASPKPSVPPPGNARPPSNKPLFQYMRGTRQAVLPTSAPENGSATKIKQWVGQVVPKSEQGNIDRIMQEIDEELKELNDGDKPALDRILIDWGLTPEKTNKMTHDSLLRVLATVHFLKKD
eukprot:s466_g13.t1